jgi:ribonuclease VapC
VIVDSSALVAILQKEPEALRLSQAMALDPVCSVSAATWLEASMIMFVRFGTEGVRDLDLLAAKASLEIADVTPRQADIARRAFMEYGKGIHPAGLDFGDCFAYALARDTGEPLLFKGNDFPKTDIPAVAY